MRRAPRLRSRRRAKICACSAAKTRCRGLFRGRAVAMQSHLALRRVSAGPKTQRRSRNAATPACQPGVRVLGVHPHPLQSPPHRVVHAASKCERMCVLPTGFVELYRFGHRDCRTVSNQRCRVRPNRPRCVESANCSKPTIAAIAQQSRWHGLSDANRLVSPLGLRRQVPHVRPRATNLLGNRV
jgi:hypothetical protein